MGNVAAAEELAGIGELDELYKLDASETETEPEPEDDEDDEDDQADDTEIHPEDMPHP
jgi:hypothetical protein